MSAHSGRPPPPTGLMPYISAQVQQAALELALFDTAARLLQPCDDGPVVPGPEGMVHSSELHLLPGSPELRDQDLPWEKVPGRRQRGQRGVSRRVPIPQRVGWFWGATHIMTNTR